MRGVEGQSNLARYIGESPQTIKNWESRGVSRAGMLKAQQVIGCSATWLETGQGRMEMTLAQVLVESHKKKYPRVVGTAKMGDKGFYYDLEGGDGYVEFEAPEGSIAIRVRGDSMHPAIRDGWYVIIEPSGQPSIGEYVLLRFKDGRKMVKELLQAKSDCFVCQSVNGGERLTAMLDDLEGAQAISAVVPPSKHKEF